MQTKPISYNGPESGAAPADGRAGLAFRIGARLLHQLKHVLPPTLFFFIGFNLIVLTTNLLLADCLAAFTSIMLASAAALVVGKAVLVADAMPFLARYDRAPLISRSCSRPSSIGRLCLLRASWSI